MPFQIPASRFTTAALSALPITGKSYDVADPAVPGLLIRVGTGGSKRWLFRFKWKKRTSRLKIGFFPEVGIAPARERALAHRKANRTAPILSQMFAFGVHRSIILSK
jgi:hypothetical protein